MSASIAYAFALGLIAAVNPCGFPLLPAYLALFAGDRSTLGWAGRTARGLASGALMTVGFVAVFGCVGLLVESGMRLVVVWVPWAMIVLAAGMVVLGIRFMSGGYLRLPLPAIRFGRGRTIGATTGFGAAYAVASLSCALPLFLAGVAGVFTRLGALDGVATFLAYALGMGVFVTGASVIAAHAGAPALRRLRPLARALPRVAGVVVTAAGLYLMIYWIGDLVDPLAADGVTRFVGGVQSGISAWLAASPLMVGGVCGVVVLAGLGVVAWAERGWPSGRAKEYVDHA